MINRRHFLATSTAAALAASCTTAGPTSSAPSLNPELTSLNAIAETSGLRFGNAIAYWGNDGGEGVNRPDNPFNDTAYMELVKKHCAMVVAENEFKRYTTQPVPGDYRFSRGDGIAEFAAQNGLDLRGHTLLWNRNTYMPQWVQDLDLDAESAEAHLDAYIGAMINRFDSVYSWDVVNETIDPETGELRNTVFTQALGEGVIDTAIRIAESHAPDAQMVYNDYMSWEKHSATHRDGVLRLLEDLLKRGSPIDALGIQGHLGTYTGDPVTGFSESHDVQAWKFFLDEVQDMGLDVIITEFDVNDEKLTADVAKRDQIVADYAREYLDMTLDYANVKEILTWGMVDHHSWLQDFWPREDGLDKRGTPFDTNYQPKPLYYALADALAAAPNRAPLG